MTRRDLPLYYTTAQTWPPTPAQLRECLFNQRVGAGVMVKASTSEMLGLAASKQMALDCQRILCNATEGGRVIDCGICPTTALAAPAAAGQDAFTKGELPLPFGADAWVTLITLDDGGDKRGMVLLVDSETGEGVRLTLLIPVMILSLGRRALLLQSCGVVRQALPGEADMRLRVKLLTPSEDEWIAEEEARMLPIPLFALTWLLQHSSLERVEPPAKLNKARRRAGKRPIPHHFRVTPDSYVTVIRPRSDPSSEGERGSHKSPLTHLRRAHLRRLHSGRVVPVRACRVGAMDDPASPRRSHYVIANSRKDTG